MTPERLQRLIREGESLTVELKGEETRSLSDDALVEAVKTHAPVSRSDVSRICGVTPREATTLLRDLVSEGRLTPVGAGRGRRYTAGPKSAGGP